MPKKKSTNKCATKRARGVTRAEFESLIEKHNANVESVRRLLQRTNGDDERIDDMREALNSALGRFNRVISDGEVMHKNVLKELGDLRKELREGVPTMEEFHEVRDALETRINAVANDSMPCMIQELREMQDALRADGGSIQALRTRFEELEKREDRSGMELFRASDRVVDAIRRATPNPIKHTMFVFSFGMLAGAVILLAFFVASHQRLPEAKLAAAKPAITQPANSKGREL